MKALSAPFPHVVIRASAGTGKTFRLAHRFLALLFAGASPDQILAVTFARKAAGEIIDRILLRLAQAIDDPQQLADLAKHVDRPDLSRERCLQLLRELLNRLHRLRIGTLDSFFIQLAGHFSFEFNLPLGWQIVDDVEDQQLRADAIHAVLADESIGDATTLVGLLFKGEAQRGVMNQVQDLVSNLYDLFLRTEADAWQQLPRRRELDPERLIEHHGALVTLPAFGDKRFTNAHQKDVEQSEKRDWLKFLSGGLAKVVASGETTYYKKPLGEQVIAAYEPLLNEARIQLTNALAHQTEATYRLLEKYDRAVRRLKHERRTLRFDDVTRELAERLNGNDVASLAFRLDTQLAHLLLDEFQDTSLAQWNVIRPFAEPVVRSPGDRTFFCVGDVKQAIYGWRGGVSEIFDCLQEQLPGVTEDQLTTSFRSSPVIIETVNHVFQRLGHNPSLELQRETAQAWQQRFAAHTTAKQDFPGYARLVVAPAAAEGESAFDVLLDFAAADIARLSRAHPERSVGVLVQRNKTVGAIMHRLRSEHQLAASEEGGNPLTDSRAVQLALSALKLADHPADTIARFHVAQSPLGAALGLSDHADDNVALRVAAQIREQLLSVGYGQTLFHWLATIGPLCDAREYKRYEQLIDLAYGYDRDATLRTADFAALVEVKRVEDPTAAKVRVMTVHQAKGLQFDVVVLPELDFSIKGPPPQVVIEQSRATDPIRAVCRYANETIQQMLPEAFGKMFEQWSRPKVNEGLCVLYVALTRAVHELHMIVKPLKEEAGGLKREEKKPTFAAILRSALAPNEVRAPGKVLFERGVSDWELPVKMKDASPKQPVTERQTPSAEPLKIRIRPAVATRGWERQSPSQLQGGQEVDLALRWSSDHSTARLRGILLHAWFEQVEWLDDSIAQGGEPSDELLDRIARQHGGLSLDLRQLREHFRHLLRQPHTRRALSKAAYKAYTAEGPIELEVKRESRFAVRYDHTLLQGAMDRVVLVRRQGQVVAAEVLDFKSDGASQAAKLEELGRHYAPQLEAYRRALQQLHGLEPRQTRSQLLFVETDQVIEV